MYSWPGKLQVPQSDFVEGEEPTSPFAEHFVLDTKSSLISPSLPLKSTGLVKSHAAQFLIDGPTHSSNVFKQVVDNTDKFVEYRNALCKLFVREDTQIHGGSGFFVSPTVLVTAAHVAVPGQKYMTLAESAPSLAHFENTDTLIPIQELGVDRIAELRAEEKLATHVDTDPVASHGPEKGQIAQCNFAFFKVDDSKSHFRADKFFLPKFKYDDKAVAVMSYPVYFDHEVVKQKRDLLRGVPSVYAAFANDFSCKHVAPGTIIKENGRLMAHTASTLKGSSGGPVIDPSGFSFVGINIEGWVDVNWNLAVCAWHPAFQKAYREFVQPTLPEESLTLFNAINHDA